MYARTKFYRFKKKLQTLSWDDLGSTGDSMASLLVVSVPVIPIQGRTQVQCKSGSAEFVATGRR